VTDQELIEKLADVQHAIWSHWMNYMFTCGTVRTDGAWVMTADKAVRWTMQAGTPYAKLTEREKESDRDQARKLIPVFGEYMEIDGWLGDRQPLQAVEAYIPGISATLATAVTTNAELGAEIAQLRSQVAALQAWKDAVLVTAILTMRFGNILDGLSVDNALEDVESWLMDIAEQPEVQP
jgi:hypothetical protein